MADRCTTSAYRSGAAIGSRLRARAAPRDDPDAERPLRRARVLGVATLLAATACYLLARPERSAYFLTLLPVVPHRAPAGGFAWWTEWFPSFAHVFGFSLLTWAALRGRIVLCCAIWCAADLTFECLQALPDAHLGVFDPLDVLACVAGGLAAWVAARALAGASQAAMAISRSAPGATRGPRMAEMEDVVSDLDSEGGHRCRPPVPAAEA